MESKTFIISSQLLALLRLSLSMFQLKKITENWLTEGQLT